MHRRPRRAGGMSGTSDARGSVMHGGGRRTVGAAFAVLLVACAPHRLAPGEGDAAAGVPAAGKGRGAGVCTRSQRMADEPEQYTRGRRPPLWDRASATGRCHEATGAGTSWAARQYFHGMAAAGGWREDVGSPVTTPCRDHRPRTNLEGLPPGRRGACPSSTRTSGRRPSTLRQQARGGIGPARRVTGATRTCPPSATWSDNRCAS